MTVAVGVSDRCQVTGDMQYVTYDKLHDTGHFFLFFPLFLLDSLLSTLPSANIKRIIVSSMHNFTGKI